jgi:hypothetical protein
MRSGIFTQGRKKQLTAVDYLVGLFVRSRLRKVAATASEVMPITFFQD